MTGPKPFHILLVDDDQDDRFLFKDALATTGLETAFDEAEGCNEALEKLANMKENIPDVLFIDLNMPDINGFECIGRIKEAAQWKDIPIIVYSTSNNQADIEKAGFMGAIAYLKKPNDFIDLCKRVKEILLIDFNKQNGYLVFTE